MQIQLEKFGTMLTSRQTGREAYAAFKPTLAGIAADEEVIVDFTGISTFSPSWGDEFLWPLVEAYGSRLFLCSSDNPSVQVTLELLEETRGITFQRRTEDQ